MRIDHLSSFEGKTVFGTIVKVSARTRADIFIAFFICIIFKITICDVERGSRTFKVAKCEHRHACLCCYASISRISRTPEFIQADDFRTIIYRQEKVTEQPQKVSDPTEKVTEQGQKVTEQETKSNQAEQESNQVEQKSNQVRLTAKQRKVLDFCDETPRTAQEILDMVGVKYHTKILLSVRFFRAGLPQTSDSNVTSGTTSHPYNLTSPSSNSLKNKGNNLTTLQANNLTSLISQITDFCAQWRTLSEIAEHVQRSRQYLRGEVIPQMFDVLERKYDSPTHPKQQYRTKR